MVGNRRYQGEGGEIGSVQLGEYRQGYTRATEVRRGGMVEGGSYWSIGGGNGGVRA